jgi:hypothetical protein
MEQTSKQKGPSFTREELRALFSLNTSTSCETAIIMQNSASGHDWQVQPSFPLLHAYMHRLTSIIFTVSESMRRGPDL